MRRGSGEGKWRGGVGRIGRKDIGTLVTFRKFSVAFVMSTNDDMSV